VNALATVRQPTPAPDDLQRYLRLLAGADPGGRLLEIRFRLRGGGMGREFVPAASCARAAGIIIRRLALVTDVYVGVALRDRRAGGRDAIGGCHLVFVEIDTPDALERVRGFQFRPTAAIASGGEGRLHCYWALSTSARVLEVEQANRQLCYHLGGDPAAVDASRVLRPPGSWNWKYEPRRSVRLLELDATRRYDIVELVDTLPIAPTNPRLAGQMRVREVEHQLDQELLAIPAEHYVRVLSGREPDRVGKVHCPFHDDRHASLQLYADGSWYCFGACRRGGTMGRAFIELRDGLAMAFGIAR
jgi:RepB DNA-primase N-terminal domain